MTSEPTVTSRWIEGIPMRILQFLQSLPFWPRTRHHYFTHGVADGKAAAFSSGITLPTDHARVGEQAIFAAAALPKPISPDDLRIYQLGWVEGYHALGRTAPVAGQ